jgi:molybdopterin-binding protein
MVLMIMVEMTRHEVVRVITVRNRFVPTARAVTVSGFVTAAGLSSGAFRRILGIYFQLVFVNMIAMHIVHVAIVKETLVTIVDDGGVAAVASVLMRVTLMSFMTHELVLLCRAMPDVWRGSQKSVEGSVSCNPVWTVSLAGRILRAMTLSARNRLEGKVVEIQFGGVMAHVVVSVGNNLIESVITKRSADEMKLKVGDTVSAVIKSTEVMLEKS